MSSKSQQVFSPLLSVIIPVYNRQGMIETALESVLASIRSAQQSIDFKAEVIVVDDGSNPPITLDNKHSILSEFIEIRMIRIFQNEGVGSARNHGIRNSRGKYLAFLDSDDEMLPNRFRSDIMFMDEYRVEFCYGTTRDMYDEDLGWQAPTRPEALTRFKANSPKLGRAYARGNHGHIHLNSVTINRQSLNNQSVQFSRLKRAEDTLFIIECLDLLYSLPNPETRPIASRYYHASNSIKTNTSWRIAFLRKSVFSKASLDTKLAIFYNCTIQELKNNFSAWLQN